MGEGGEDKRRTTVRLVPKGDPGERRQDVLRLGCVVAMAKGRRQLCHRLDNQLVSPQFARLSDYSLQPPGDLVELIALPAHLHRHLERDLEEPYVLLARRIG